MKTIICLLVLFLPLFALPQTMQKKYAPANYTWRQIGNTPSYGHGQNIAISTNGEPYIATEKSEFLQSEAEVIKFNGTDWEYVGQQNSFGRLEDLRLAINHEGLPYIAFQDISNGGGASVLKFDGVNWSCIGSSSFTWGSPGWISFAIDASDNPYLAWEDTDYPSYGALMKYEAPDWKTIGNPFIYVGSYFSFPSLSISPSGLPYVAFCDQLCSSQASVMKYDTLGWRYIGDSCFSSGTVRHSSLAFGPDETPYLAYEYYDGIQSTDGIAVMKYNGLTWEYVGTQGALIEYGNSPDLVFSPSGDPYLTMESPSGIGIKMFDGHDWVDVGDLGSLGSSGYDSKLAFSPMGELYVSLIGDDEHVVVLKYDSLYVGHKELEKPKLVVYPNPATTCLNIILPNNPVADSYVEVIDTRGIIMTSDRIVSGKCTINTAYYPGGLYFVKVMTNESSIIGRFTKL